MISFDVLFVLKFSFLPVILFCLFFCVVDICSLTVNKFYESVVGAKGLENDRERSWS